MLNPDGVIHGNSRTNLIGYDINRNWDVSSPTKTAETLQIWSYLLQLVQEEYRIQWSFDLHGHSKELGYFAYFCEENE
jgi:murein tripeptide amidase MpaA